MDLSDLIGVKHTCHGRSKEEGFDCYGLAMEVLGRAGINLPDYKYETLMVDEAKGVYNLAVKGIPHTRLDRPEPNCIVMLNVRTEPIHCAVYIGDGKIIHTTKYGVVIENLKRWENRISGFYRVNN